MVGDAPDRRVEILCDHDSLHATWSRFGPGRDGADLHVHRQHTDLFYVLDGELTLRLGPQGEQRRMPAGTLVRVPPGVVHGFRNGSDADVRYLNFHAPGVGFAGYMRDRRDGRPAAYDQFDPPEDGGRPISEAVFGEWPSEPAIKIHEDVVEPGMRPHSHIDLRNVELYVLEGEIVVAARGEELRAVTGAWVHVPPEIGHALSAAGSARARFLVVHTPAA